MPGKLKKKEVFTSLETLRQKINGEIFDYQILKENLHEIKHPRSKIGRLLKSGEIVRIKKGLYIFGKSWKRGPVSLEIAANLIYGPSCISFEYALFRYGMIPERATVLTSLAIGKAKEFRTPIGIFRYQSIRPEKFGVGIDYIELPDIGGFFIASREKALADLLSRIKTSLSLSDLRFFLFHEMRMDEKMFSTLNKSKIEEIAFIYKNKNIENLSLL